MQSRRFLVLLLVSASLPLSAQAANDWPLAGRYVSASELSPLLLPPPPAEGSPQWQKDIAIILADQKVVDADTLSAIRDEQHLRLSLLTDLVPGLTQEALPRTYALLLQVLADTEGVSEADKQYWHTRRPYLADGHVQLFIDRIDSSPSYPSGHTSGSRVVAEIMGLLYPAQVDVFRARADAIANDRIVAGAHYPADIAAGRSVAMLVMGALLKDDAFRQDLTAARKEIGEYNSAN